MRWLLLAAAVLSACSKTETTYIEVPVDEPDAGAVTPVSPDSGLGVMTFRPPRAYSGYDGTRTFQVPVAVYDADDDLVVTASNGATVEPKRLTTPTRDGITDNGRYFFVTVQRPGDITLTARSKGRQVTATITVASYAANRWAAGQARYMNASGSEPPCADCHVNGAAIDHSPASLATATDEKIQVVVTTGISTGNVPIVIDRPQGHKWTVTAAELDGLVTYLRALSPKGFQ